MGSAYEIPTWDCVADANMKMGDQSSFLPPTTIHSLDTRGQGVSEPAEPQSHMFNMSIETSLEPHYSERSQGTSKTPEFSSHTTPEFADHDVKQEPDISVEAITSVGGDYNTNVDMDMGIDFPTQNQPAALDNLTGSNSISSPKSISKDGPSPAKRRRISSSASQLQFTRMRSKTSNIATELPREELARQSIDAALASRLNPYTLRADEYALLRGHISRAHVTAYLNVRNRILRLWIRNPLVSVTPEEAAGCASEDKWLALTQVAYDWLVRNGFINFGCVEVPDFSVMTKKAPKLTRPRERIIVIGAGVAGLGCARQLEGLFNHYRQSFWARGQEPPEVKVLEGRARIGGRIYSFPLKDQNTSGIPASARATAEMGAHIITGFDHGNPMNILLRGQLAVPCYPLKDNSKLYDIDGKIVDSKRDRMAERLFNDMLDRASAYRHKQTKPKTISGDRDLIEAGRDPTEDLGLTINEEIRMQEAQGNGPSPPQHTNQVPVGIDKLTGKLHVAAGEPTTEPPVDKAEAIGFEPAKDQSRPPALDLDNVAHSKEFPTLGQIMDEGVKQYQRLLELTPQDLRLLNWHIANLEYANAVNLGNLSLGGWDLDIGNEFEGEHAQVIGGYIQVPQGLLQAPNALELKTRKHVSQISYDPLGSENSKVTVECADGSREEADMVVCTVPLGVLKAKSVTFDPPLPDWKTRSIDKLGFGLLNKLVLVFDKPFWDVDRDMIGLLRDTPNPQSSNQEDYTTNRGRFYLFWNCIKTTGRPVLIALMAGDAAVQAEERTDGDLVLEVLEQLQSMFKQNSIPVPTETVVTRWAKDKFARGTYSYVGAEAHSEDYDNMAKKVGNLYFAGEATCTTHPATVHGAYISGLRAATEIVEDLLGPIDIPQPLVPAVVKADRSAHTPSGPAMVQTTPASTPKPKKVAVSSQREVMLQKFENDIISTLIDRLGPRPDKPEKAGSNPFLLFSKDHWAECKTQCDAQHQAVVGNPQARASRNQVRAALGKMWREATEEDKLPYIQRTNENRLSNKDARSAFEERLETWDKEAIKLRKEYIAEHPDVLTQEEEAKMWEALGVFPNHGRKAKIASGFADDQSNNWKEHGA